MNKVIIINLNGNAYQLEESGYDALRVYLEGAARRLGQNPDRNEIIADIEQAIADKFRGLLGKHKSVVETKEVAGVIAEMGPVRDDSSEDEDAAATGTSSSASTSPSGFASKTGVSSADTSGTAGGAAGATGAAAASSFGSSAGSNKGGSGFSAASASGGSEADGPARRLYKIPEGAMIAGVCNGIAAYLSLDVILVRLAFAAIAIVIGLFALLVHWFFLLPIIIYTVLAITLPAANTPAERAAARGDPATAQEYIRRAKQGYYNATRQFTDPATRREWRRRYRQDMRRGRYQWNAYTPPEVPTGSAACGSTGRVLAPSFALPLVGLLQFCLVLGFVLSLVHLISHGGVFGASLPEGVPLWVGIVALVLIFQVVSWPLKALRHACLVSLSGDRSQYIHGSFVDTLVWFAAFVAAVWVADHYIPAVHDFLSTLPARISSLAEALGKWWNSR
jgi:phage shock protein PspC (stress-responsive transcriptional regulator)